MDLTTNEMKWTLVTQLPVTVTTVLNPELNDNIFLEYVKVTVPLNANVIGTVAYPTSRKQTAVNQGFAEHDIALP